MNRLFFLVGAFCFGVPHATLAEWRCDCTTVVDACTATVTVRESWVDIQSDHQQCARVDYFIDGLPFVSTVVEGQARQDWLVRTENPQVFVQSCQVCRDNHTGPRVTATPTRDTEAQPVGDLEPMVRIEPEYPPGARAQGVEGSVTVVFTVAIDGRVENARVVESMPPGVFEQTVLNAVRRWRYEPDPDREPTVLSEKLEFSFFTDPVFLLAPRGSSSRPAAARRGTVAPLNECVRENVAYDFGEMVEVGLMNACSEPLLVFGCALGTGELRGKWTCVDSERLRLVLLRPGDRRVGSTTFVDTAAGERSFSYSENVYVTRAPNTQYWWIACRQADRPCRDSASQWARSVHRQLAHVSPGDRTSIAVARSQ